MSTTSGLFGQKFQIQKKLGEGGMGAVYKALDVKLGRLVAIKVLQASVAGNEMFKSRFQKEARSQARFNHPNIVILYDSDFTSEGQPYMVMEFIDGMPLDEFLRQNGALPLDRLMALFSQISSGVAVAHNENVIHRDLKPANLMLCKDSTGQEVIKILDLGLAKMVEAATGQDEVQTQKTMGATQAGMVLGTPQYMSPEQATGGDVDCRTDVYALGMILCEMATGKLPYNATSAMQWIAKQISEVPPPPSKIRPDLKLPKALDTVFVRAVAKEADERYASAQEMYQDLVNKLAEEGFSYGQGKSSIVIIKQKSNTTLVALLFVAVILLGGAGIGGYFAWTAKRHTNFVNALNDAKVLRDNAFTKDGIKLEAIDIAIKSYETAQKFADSKEDRDTLDQYLPVINEVKEIGKNEKDQDLRQAYNHISKLITNKSNLIDLKRFTGERDRIEEQLKKLDDDFDKNLQEVRASVNDVLKTGKADGIPALLDSICTAGAILVPGSNRAGFDQAKTSLLALYNNHVTNAQTAQQTIDDLVKKMDVRTVPEGQPSDQQLLRNLLVDLMVLRFNELGDVAKTQATQASKEKKSDLVKEAAKTAIDIYQESKLLAGKPDETLNRPKLVADAETGIANCEVLSQVPGIADLLEKFITARKTSQEAVDKEQWGHASASWKKTADLADELVRSQIPKEKLHKLMALPDNTEFSGETLRKTAIHCDELEAYQKNYDDAMKVWGQARQDQRYMGDALKGLESTIKQYEGLTPPKPSNEPELRKQFAQARQRLASLFQDNLKMAQDQFNRNQYNDASKTYAVVQDLGRLFPKGEEPVEMGTLADKIHDCNQKVIFESGITKLQQSLLDVDKYLKNTEPDKAQAEYEKALTYKGAVEAAGFAGTIKDELARLAAVPAVITGQKAYLDAMASAQAASVAGKENWVEMLKGFKAAKGAVVKMPAEYQPRVDLDEKIKNTNATIKTEFAKLDESTMVIYKQADFLGALDRFKQLQLLGSVLDGDDVPIAYAALQAKVDRCLRYKNPPVIDLGNGNKIEFVYVESPRGCFYMSKCEISNIQFEQINQKHFTKRPDFQKQNGDNHPVVKISYNDCREFCTGVSRLAEKVNAKYSVRMPTENEWVDAATFKADNGLDPTKGTFRSFPWGADLPDPPKKNFMNYSGMQTEDFSDNEDRYKLDGFLKTAPIGSFPLDVSPSGCFDMGGNVQEWVALDDPKSEVGAASQKRKCKGASFHHSAMAAKARPEEVTEIFVDKADNDYIGFRILLDIGEAAKK